VAKNPIAAFLKPRSYSDEDEIVNFKNSLPLYQPTIEIIFMAEILSLKNKLYGFFEQAFCLRQ
jgi:hypothetical protein